jgi:hypothetical protein
MNKPQVLTREQVSRIKVPDGLHDSALPHKEVLDYLDRELAGEVVAARRYVVWRQNKARLTGVYELNRAIATGVGSCIVVRTAFDRSYPLWVGYGLGTPSGIAVWPDEGMRQKYTRMLGYRVEHLIRGVVEGLPAWEEQAREAVMTLRGETLTAVEAESLILRGWLRGIVPPREVKSTVGRWEQRGLCREGWKDSRWMMLECMLRGITPLWTSDPGRWLRLSAGLVGWLVKDEAVQEDE